MRSRQVISLIMVFACLALGLPRRASAQQEQPEIKVPKDLRFVLELLSPISTATNQKGDSFSCKVLDANVYAGAIISGHIKKLKRSGKTNKKSEMELGFDSITLTDGRTGGFNAQVVEVFDVAEAGNEGKADSEGTVKSKSRVKVSVKRAVAGAIVGGVLGGIIAGPKGAAAGAAIGASIGVTSVLATDGPDLEFRQGTQFAVLTNAPARREKSQAARPSAPPPQAPPSAAPPQPPAADTARSAPIQPQASVSPPVNAAIPPLRPAQPVTPRAPSTRLRIYTGNALFSLSIPTNWRESSGANPVTFAPDGGFIFYREQLVLTHGLRIEIQPTQTRDLQQSASLYAASLLQSNTYLQQRGTSQKGSIAGRESLIMVFSGDSPATGRAEIVTLYTTTMRNGNLFHVITVASQEQSQQYEAAFQNAIRSLQLKG